MKMPNYLKNNKIVVKCKEDNFKDKRITFNLNL